MFANNYRESAGGLANSYQPDRKLATDVDALIERATALKTSNTQLNARVALLTTEKSELEARLAAIERWAVTLTGEPDL